MADHPVKVPPELFTEWLNEAVRQRGGWLNAKPGTVAAMVADCAAQWGADQELEACCEWVSQWRCLVGGNRPENELRAARRPKPPTLAEQAATALHAIASGANDAREQYQDIETLTAALNRLAELEANQ